jgi:hypothetical protein
MNQLQYGMQQKKKLAPSFALSESNSTSTWKLHEGLRVQAVAASAGNYGSKRGYDCVRGHGSGIKCLMIRSVG